MDPATGEILALADYPWFDPNHSRARSPSATRAESHHRRVRAGIGEQGHHRLGRDGGGLFPLTRVLADPRPLPVGGARVPRLARAPGPADDPGRHHRVLEQHRDDHDRAARRPALLAAYLARFGYGRRTGIRFPGEAPGILPRPGRVVGDGHGQHPHRPGDRRDAAADGERLRDDRERRGVGRSPAWCAGRCDADGTLHAGARAGAHAACRPRGHGRAGHGDAGLRGRGRHRHRGPDPGLLGGRQDGHRPQAAEGRARIQRQARGLVHRVPARRRRRAW